MLDFNDNQTNNCPTPSAAVEPPFPGTALRPGSSGSDVARIQEYLNALGAARYPTLIRLVVDGRYGSATSSAVMQYQAFNGLSMDGVVGRITWDAIVGEYNELTGGGSGVYPGVPLRPGSTGEDVRYMQRLLNELSRTYTAVNRQTEDGIFGQNMSNAVRRFQRQFALTADGVIGPRTWERIVEVHRAMTSRTPTHVTTNYGGTALRTGSRGDDVRFAQSYLNGAGGSPTLNVDGIFGPSTSRAAAVFQSNAGLVPDGVIGPATWRALIPAFNASL